ncbi:MULTISPECIES: hypothetical protein [unclassified Streptomyces]|uniref:hypothetical protein n=1 Tax=unclassified Streptomyces TaxID=2593676 RepID=UPI000B0AA697|nr:MULTISPECIES: hypothetical protein [unclassified Streptomyces]
MRAGREPAEPEPEPEPDAGAGRGSASWWEGGDWFEFTLAVLLALAAVGTAWAGFQSAKWSGVQANSYASAAAARTESTRRSTEAGQFLTIDVIMFTQWLTALNEEILADPSQRPEGTYRPDPDTVSGLLFTRFRSEFKPAVTAWLRTRPLSDPAAPVTPFAMPEYRLSAEEDALRRLDEAQRLSERARQANQRSDNYVLTAVLFALVLFFSSLAGRARSRLARMLLFGLSVLTLAGAAVLLLLYPVEV